MWRFWIFLCILFLLSIMCSYRAPIYFLQFCGQEFYQGLQHEASIWSRVWVIILVELTLHCASYFFGEFFGGGRLETKSKPVVKANAVTQTTGQWLKKFRRQDRIHSEVSRIVRQEVRRTRKHRLTLIKKYKFKSSNIKKEKESKTKLMASVNKKVMSLALEIDGLINRIQEKRFILDRQRDDNKRVLQRYEQLYQDIQNRYMYE
ncbi:uncharacterized protein LOC117343468 [Pecten maximus]|uniref:uncharacterized protein LOC117343468 n=1 Tax=Pecten maximus TaxID=6579 RepID=UPI001459184C|nr:uncharacterized protein LOC117343468 [Pecten maximus]